VRPEPELAGAGAGRRAAPGPYLRAAPRAGAAPGGSPAAMVSAKKEKKGTGAERRKDQRREAALSRPYRKDSDKKKREREERKEKRRRKAAKGEPEAPPRDYRTAARLARRCFSALFAICVFSRGNFGEAFGHGTGVNRANLAPITVAAHALMKSEFIENDHQRSVKAKMVSRALMVPGEVIGPRMPRKMRPPSRSKKFGGHLPGDPLSEKARAALDAAVADKGLGKVRRNSGGHRRPDRGRFCSPT